MQIIINVTDIRITRWTVDVNAQHVVIDYQLLKDDGSVYDSRTAIFWVTLPGGEQEPYWYLLPAEYLATLTSLTEDARTTLLATIA